MDVAALVREAQAHQLALTEHRERAREHQEARDRIVHQLRAGGWSYPRIAAAVGLTPENVVKICGKPVP